MITFLLFFGKPKDKQVKCPRCGRLNLAKCKFCKYCGLELPKLPGIFSRIKKFLLTLLLSLLGLTTKPLANFCPECHKTFPLDERYCCKHGTKLQTIKEVSRFQTMTVGFLGGIIAFAVAPYVFHSGAQEREDLARWVIGFIGALAFMAMLNFRESAKYR
jgi:hypothetical protein